ncbi:MAG: hypothetical protein D9V44_10005 [Actinobacteria bacterium]|nr:MAG: hypothetical protein D9V44_10005 [Actinomycetota bacterium]
MHCNTRLSHLLTMATAVMLLTLVLMLSLTSPALAASVPLSVEQMSREARSVAVVDCVSAVPRLVDPVAGPRGGIVTDFTFRVTETVLGAPESLFTVTQQGGEVGGIGLAISELPRFSRNRRYVVFVGGDGQIVGGLQGALSVSGERVGSSREPLTSLKRRVRAAAGMPVTLTETLSQTLVARAADAAAAVVTPLAAPVISAMTPSNVSAGTGDVVTISGSGFGVTAGSVDFYNRAGYADITAVITSWSDTTITCEVPKGAGSGAVTVTTSSAQTSSDYAYDVGFSFGGAAWSAGVLSETYRVNPNCLDAGAGEVAAVGAAAATWSAASNFSFTYGGACSSTLNPSEYNSSNDIYWAVDGFSGSTLAWNRYWYFAGSPYNRIIESDIVFNDNYAWGDGTGGTFDIQAVALHELGHSLNLSDQYGTNEVSPIYTGASQTKVMCGTIGINSQRRTLTEDDIAGARWIYGATGDVTPPVMGAVSSTTHPSDTSWYTEDNDVTFTWSATDAGPVTYSYVLDHTSGTNPDTTPEGAATTVSFPALADGEWYLHVRARDSSGNWSTTQQRRVRVDVTAPTGSFMVNGGDATTNQTSVTIDSAVTGATEMRIAADGATYGPWVAYAAQADITIPAVEGTRTVLVQYRDAALNTLACSDSIVYDAAARAFSWTEIAGPDRYATALAVSEASFADGSCDTVIISTGIKYPDALGAGGLAGAVNCPILLVRATGGLDSSVRSEILRLTRGQPKRTVYITGSSTVVSTQTEKDLKALVGSANVKRLGGTDRFATANLVARELRSVLDSKGIPFSGKAFVTTGMDFPDALLASPVAFSAQRPILLLGRSGLDANLRATITALGVTELQIVGSTSSVPTAVETAMAGMSGVTVRRVASASDKYAMTVAFAEWAYAEEGFTCLDAGIATGDKFPDALAAGPLQGATKSLVILTPPNYLDARIRALLEENYADAEHVRFLGSTAAVSQTARDAVIAVLE